MIIGKVIGNVVSTIKHPSYKNLKLLVVQPMEVIPPEMKLEEKYRIIVAVDCAGAGKGDTVLVTSSPGIAREVLKLDVCPIREMIVGIIDKVEL